MTAPNPAANERFRSTLKLLLEKTLSNDVNWRRVERYDGATELVAEFPSERIALAFISPRADPDFYSAELRTKHNGTVLEIRGAEDDPDWGLLAALFVEAERSALGWDRALAEIDQALRQGEPTSAHTSEITDDDIPF